MKPFQRRFTISYWVAVFTGLILYSLVSGMQYKWHRIEAAGKVVAQVNMPEYVVEKGDVRSIDHYRPQIAYTVGNTEYRYIDKERELATGTPITVLYQKGKPAAAESYSYLIWFNYNVLMPAFVIASFVFCVVLISITNYGKQREILPGELDVFVSEKVSGVYTG